MTTWWGLMAPGKTAQAVVDRLAAEAPAEFTAFVERERTLYAELVRRSGATVD